MTQEDAFNFITPKIRGLKNRETLAIIRYFSEKEFFREKTSECEAVGIVTGCVTLPF